MTWGLRQNFGIYWKNTEGPKFTNGLGSHSKGLILWENDATGLGIMFLISIWPPGAQKIKKIPSLLSADAGAPLCPCGREAQRLCGCASRHMQPLRSRDNVCAAGIECLRGRQNLCAATTVSVWQMQRKCGRCNEKHPLKSRWRHLICFCLDGSTPL